MPCSGPRATSFIIVFISFSIRSNCAGQATPWVRYLPSHILSSWPRSLTEATGMEKGVLEALYLTVSLLWHQADPSHGKYCQWWLFTVCSLCVRPLANVLQVFSLRPWLVFHILNKSFEKQTFYFEDAQCIIIFKWSKKALAHPRSQIFSLVFSYRWCHNFSSSV